MGKTATLNIRVNPDVKENAESVLAQLGIPMATAIDLLAPDNAMGQYNRIADEILTLDTFPERFRIMDSEPEKRMELRRMLVDNYSVFYTIRDERKGVSYVVLVVYVCL